MNKHYKEILEMVKEASKKDFGYFNIAKYLGTGRKIYGIDTATKKEIVSRWKKEHKELTFNEFIELIFSLNKGDSYEEKILSSSILFAYPNYRKKIDPKILDQLLDHLAGWAEIDNLCQSTFSADEVLAQWDKWEPVLKAFNKSEAISKKRASLVLLVKPCRESTDRRLSEIAFRNITNLAHERDVLITKAISWLLRELTKKHKEEVKDYLAANQDILPKLAVRETSRKLETGKKS